MRCPNYSREWLEYRLAQKLIWQLNERKLFPLQCLAVLDAHLATGDSGAGAARLHRLALRNGELVRVVDSGQPEAEQKNNFNP